MQSHEAPGPPGDKKEDEKDDQKENKMEDRLREMWAKVLQQPIHTLEASSNFFLSGGDSLLAIHLGALAHENLWHLTFQDVYTHPILSDMAQMVRPLKKLPLESDPKPQLEIPNPVRSLIAKEVKVDSNVIQFICPASATQEGFIALAATNGDAHIIRYTFIVPREVDLPQLKESWRRVVKAHQILRTRFYHTATGMYQVVLNDDFHWETQDIESSTSIKDKINNDFHNLNGPLSRFYLLTHDDNSHLLVWAVSRALTDDCTSSQIFAEVHAAYVHNSEIPPERPFSVFTQADGTMPFEKISYFWKEQLNRGTVVEYPVLPFSQFQPITSSQLLDQFCVSCPLAPSQYTFALRVRAAWAITVSEVTQYRHVLFGLSLGGRNGFHNVAGPTATTVPLRILVKPDQPLTEFLGILQQQALDMMPYEHTGMNCIAKIGASCPRSYSYKVQNLLIVQVPQDVKSRPQAGNTGWIYPNRTDTVWPYALVVHVRPEVAAVEILMEYDDKVFNKEEIQGLMTLFSLILLRILGGPESQTVGEILTGLSPPTKGTEPCQDGRMIEYCGRSFDATKIENQIADIIGIDQSSCYVKLLQLGKEANDVVLSTFIDTCSSDADGFAQYVSILEAELGKHLPTHMTPGLYLPFPIVHELSPHQRQLINSKYSQKTTFNSSSSFVMSSIGCLTLAEDILIDCWEQVLGIKIVSLDANFVSLGGDSIKAVRLTHAARVANLQLSVNTVLRKPVLRHMAVAASIIEMTPNRENALSTACDLSALKESKSFLVDTGECNSQAIFPVTPYQNSTFSDSLRNSGSCVLQSLYRLYSEFDVKKFERAWNRVCVEFPSLRTTLVHAKNGSLLQVISSEVTKPEKLQFANLDDLKNHMKHILPTVTQLDACLSQIILADVGPQKELERYMVLSIHQAIFDAHTLVRIHKALIQAYHDDGILTHSVALGEYVTFLDSQNTAMASRYWRHYLKGAEATIFPPYPSRDYITHPDQEHKVILRLRQSPIQTITIPTVIRAAWGILLTTLTRTRDATYCELDSGRTAKKDNIEHYAGPTSNLIPIRVKVESKLNLTIRNFLGEIQIQTSRMRPYTGLGLETIASFLPENFKLFDFHSLLVIHNDTGKEKVPEKDIPMRAMSSSMKLDGCLGLMLQCVITTGGVCMNIRWDEMLISNSLIEILCLRMEFLLRAMVEGNPLVTVEELRGKCCSL
ncbi:acetyl-CoA synthetase-like protein [Penicillium malachiteum]|uniref:acetyl-CoA synthetase-like protein n=1 Tax=Penicillium malachiteum TaxID=1324776 RepID=UPI002546ED33|nr:acetyl-CoA synthetase-like protein [Penicillium malachiteum]KAJ5729245.1 acetyl-CoA synthetase-like protein [Penicillium malachiteum]